MTAVTTGPRPPIGPGPTVELRLLTLPDPRHDASAPARPGAAISAVPRLLLNLGFGVVFLAGAYWLWTALAVLLLGRDATWSPAAALGTAVACWALLGASERRPVRPERAS